MLEELHSMVITFSPSQHFTCPCNTSLHIKFHTYVTTEIKFRFSYKPSELLIWIRQEKILHYTSLLFSKESNPHCYLRTISLTREFVNEDPQPQFDPLFTFHYRFTPEHLFGFAAISDCELTEILITNG
jgi:hypothetical protein